MKHFSFILVIFIFVLLAGGCTAGGEPSDAHLPTSQYVGVGVFFDDFNYSGPADQALAERGWTVRTEAGGPGVPGARWLAEGVSFVDDAGSTGNRLAQLSASTDGTPENTTQAEFYQQRKFYEGTYASRVRFADAPRSGPDGDQIVETFFTITPLNYPMDPDYGEIDFEYLPNGGWGQADSTLWLTTWETYQPDPWEADSAWERIPASYDGWHTLVVQVAGAKVRYFMDGVLLAEHGDQFFPETPMSINYNLWFIADGLAASEESRQYVEQVDWLYYAGNEVLSPAEVDARVEALRAAGTSYQDQLPAWTPPPVVIPSTPTPFAAGPRPFEAAIHRVNGIQVDGRLDDWSGEPTFTIQDGSRVVYLAENETWGGPGDLSARAWVGWSDEGLYMAFDVTDNRIVQEWSGADLWQGDYVEVQLDTLFDLDYNDHTVNEDDYQFGFTPGDFNTHPAGAYAWLGAVSEDMLQQIQQAQTRTETGYILEVFLPGDLLPAVNFSEGTVIGLNVNPSDCDTPDVVQRLMLSTSTIRVRTDPTTLGKVTLVGP
jgi:hypothetical protein